MEGGTARSFADFCLVCVVYLVCLPIAPEIVAHPIIDPPCSIRKHLNPYFRWKVRVCAYASILLGADVRAVGFGKYNWPYQA